MKKTVLFLSLIASVQGLYGAAAAAAGAKRKHSAVEAASSSSGHVGGGDGLASKPSALRARVGDFPEAAMPRRTNALCAASSEKVAPTGTPIVSPEEELSPAAIGVVLASLESTADVGADSESLLEGDAFTNGEQALLRRFLRLYPKEKFAEKKYTIARLNGVKAPEEGIRVNSYAIVEHKDDDACAILQYGYVVEREVKVGVWKDIFVGYAEPKAGDPSKPSHRYTTVPVHFFKPDSKFNLARKTLHDRGVDWYLCITNKYGIRGWHKYIYEHSSPRKHAFLTGRLGLSEELADRKSVG